MCRFPVLLVLYMTCMHLIDSDYYRYNYINSQSPVRSAHASSSSAVTSWKAFRSGIWLDSPAPGASRSIAADPVASSIPSPDPPTLVRYGRNPLSRNSDSSASRWSVAKSTEASGK